MNMRESRNILIVTLIVAVVAVVGSSLYSKYDFKGTGMSGQTKTKWKVDMTSVSVCTLKDQGSDERCQAIYGDASNVEEKTFIVEGDSLKANFTAELNNYNDSITYKVVVKNSGSLRAKLNSVRFSKNSNGPVIFTYNNLVEGEIIEPNSSKTFYVMASYVEDREVIINQFETQLELNFAVAE